MKNSNNYQLVVPNNETYLTTETKDSIQSAVALAIIKGKDINVTQKHSTEVTPNINIDITKGISLNIGCTVKITKKNKYIMKE